MPDNLGDLDKEMSNLDLHNMPYRESSEPDWKVLYRVAMEEKRQLKKYFNITVIANILLWMATLGLYLMGTWCKAC